MTVIMTSPAPQESCWTIHGHFWSMKGWGRSLHSSSWSCLGPNRGLSWPSQADITKYPRMGGLNNINVFLTVLEAGKPKIKMLVLFSGPLPGSRWLPSCCVSHLPLSGVSYKDTNVIGSVPHTYDLNYLLRGPSPNTAAMVGLRVSTYEFWGDTVQSIAGTVHALSIEVSQTHPPTPFQWLD